MDVTGTACEWAEMTGVRIGLVHFPILSDFHTTFIPPNFKSKSVSVTAAPNKVSYTSLERLGKVYS
jgi:hypothetical protein